MGAEQRAVLLTRIWIEVKQQNSPSDSCAQKTGVHRGEEKSWVFLCLRLWYLNQKEEMQKRDQTNRGISEVFAFINYSF